MIESAVLPGSSVAKTGYVQSYRCVASAWLKRFVGAQPMFVVIKFCTNVQSDFPVPAVHRCSVAAATVGKLEL